MGAEKHKKRPCVILGAGEILDYGRTASLVPAGSFVICADRGYLHCARLGLEPDLLVGDFDSLQKPPEGIARISLDPRKDYTDTDHAVAEALARGCNRLLLCGMLGGRLDHTLANLSTLGACARRGANALLTDGVTDVHPLAAQPPTGGELMIAPRAGCYFSLLSLVDACSGVTIDGGAYPLENYPLSSLEARAVSNEFCGVPVRVSMQRGVLLVVVTPKD